MWVPPYWVFLRSIPAKKVTRCYLLATGAVLAAEPPHRVVGARLCLPLLVRHLLRRLPRWRVVSSRLLLGCHNGQQDRRRKPGPWSPQTRTVRQSHEHGRAGVTGWVRAQRPVEPQTRPAWCHRLHPRAWTTSGTNGPVRAARRPGTLAPPRGCGVPHPCRRVRHGGQRALPRLRGLAIAACRTCPALAPCHAWLMSLDPGSRPSGVVAGEVVHRRPRRGAAA